MSGSVTITVESSTDGATTLSCMNFSEYIGRVTIFSLMVTTAFCLVVRLGLDFVSGWLVGHVFVLLSDVSVTLLKRVGGLGKKHDRTQLPRDVVFRPHKTCGHEDEQHLAQKSAVFELLL